MNRTKKDILFNLYMYFFFSIVGVITTIILLIFDASAFLAILLVIMALIFCVYQIVLYLVLHRHEQREECFQKVLDSYDLCLNFYNQALYDIEDYKNKIDELKQKLDKSKTIFWLLRYKHLMNKLDTRITQRSLYKGYLDYYNIKKYGSEFPNWVDPKELEVKE